MKSKTEAEIENELGKVFTEGTYDQIEQNENVREIYLGKSDA